MSKSPQRRGLTRSQRHRIRREIAKFRKTEVISDWLAKKIAKYDWVRYEAFPALRPHLSGGYWDILYSQLGMTWQHKF